MKKSKLFVAAGAFVLTLTAIFATKANKKNSSLTTAYVGAGVGYYFNAPSGVMTTTTQGGQLGLQIYTSNTSTGHIIAHGALATKAGGKAVFYNL